ncbi:hypothetical protein, partial [Pseudomonas aeruginosa]|uniref:hypothetical protein n=1 Tax=Pseudomonas aeruginosa TaxID=287 RepID=UPI0035256D1D
LPLQVGVDDFLGEGRYTVPSYACHQQALHSTDSSSHAVESHGRGPGIVANAIEDITSRSDSVQGTCVSRSLNTTSTKVLGELSFLVCQLGE